MGSKPSKCKTQTSKNHIYYAVKFKNRQEVSIIDSDILMNEASIENNESNMYITFDVDDMKNCTNEATRSKLERENVLDCESQRLKEIVQFWPSSSRENLTGQKQTNSSKKALTRLEWVEQRKNCDMSSSKGKLSWTNTDEGSKRNVKSTAAQAGSFVNLREGPIFKSRSHKGSNSSGSSVNQKEVFSDSKSRCQSDSFDHSGAKRKNKHSARSTNQLDSSFETKSKYSSDNLSDTHSTVRMRDLDLRLKGSGNSESHSRNKSLENGESRSKKIESIKEVHSAHSNKSDVDDSNFPNDYIDARWQALCTSNDKEQVLVPCPTCGRRFNEDAAYRHFPICSKVKEKGSSIRAPKNIVRPTCSPNSPSFINVMADDPLDINKRDDGSGRKPTKPIVFTFTRGGHKSSNKTPEVKVPSKSSEQCKQTAVSSTKNCMKNHSPATSKKGSGNSIVHKPEAIEPKSRKRKTCAPRSDGVRKSATIWRKSIKEFKTIADITTVKTTHSSTTDESSVSNKVEPPVVKVPITIITDESRNNSAASESRCQNCGKLNNPAHERNRIGPRAKSKSRKSFNGKYRAMNNKPLSRSAKDMTNLQDLDIIPQSLRIKDNIVNLKKSHKLENSYFDSFEEKTEPCFCCTRLIRSSQIETHAYLCERIKNIEMLISKDGLKSGEPSTVSGIQSSTSKKQVSSGAQSGNEVWGVDSVTPKDFRLFKQGSETPSGTCLRTITSMKCPCCAQILELRRK